MLKLIRNEGRTFLTDPNEDFNVLPKYHVDSMYEGMFYCRDIEGKRVAIRADSVTKDIKDEKEKQDALGVYRKFLEVHAHLMEEYSSKGVVFMIPSPTYDPYVYISKMCFIGSGVKMPIEVLGYVYLSRTGKMKPNLEDDFAVRSFSNLAHHIPKLISL